MLYAHFAYLSQLSGNVIRETSEFSKHRTITSEEFQDSHGVLQVAMSRTISVEPFMSYLTEIPHLLIVGDLTADRAQGMNAIITSLLHNSYPKRDLLINLGMYVPNEGEAGSEEAIMP